MANSLIRFDPFTEIARFDPFRNLDDFFIDSPLMATRAAVESTQRMRIDVTEDNQNYLVKADIPGARKENIKVTINGSQVSVTAETKEEKEIGSVGMLLSERYYGQQHRSFTLPREVDEVNAQAKFENGVLQLTLPKKQEAGGKQLAIQ